LQSFLIISKYLLIISPFLLTNFLNTKSAAITNDVDLIPYVGIEANDGAAAALDVSYCAISRLIFE